jgi:very-short-patch-repair endonuclease
MEAPRRTFDRAKDLRRHMSLPEVLLWQALRPRANELKFRRQHPLGHYILDFYCSKLRLAVEVDGYSHGTAGQPQHDARRDAWLATQGVEVLRLSASTVLDDMDATLATIAAAVDRRRAHLPPPPASQGAPP